LVKGTVGKKESDDLGVMEYEQVLIEHRDCERKFISAALKPGTK
jgi:hypothetical protein